MTAKQIRVSTISLLVGVLVLSLGVVALGEEVQTDSHTLPGAASIVEGCIALTDQALLLDLLETAGAGGFLTDEQAMQILAVAGVPSLDGSDPEWEATVQSALIMVLNAINTSMIDPEGALLALAVALEENAPLEALTALLDEQASPPGILNAIWNAAVRLGYVQTDSGTLFARIEIAVQSGVPPGIAVRIAKDALRSGLDPEEQISLLVEILAVEGTSPGQAANQATDKGKNESAVASSNKPDKPKKDNKGQNKKD